jgi:hypothetical protein
MGYFLLYESMLDTVLLARDKYLVSALEPGGEKQRLTSASGSRRSSLP